MSDRTKNRLRRLETLLISSFVASTSACQRTNGSSPITPRSDLAGVRLFVPTKGQVNDRPPCVPSKADALATQIATIAADDFAAAGYTITRDPSTPHDVNAVLRITFSACSGGETFAGAGWMGLVSVERPERQGPSTDLDSAQGIEAWSAEIKKAVQHLQRFSELVVPASRATASHSAQPAASSAPASVPSAQPSTTLASATLPNSSPAGDPAAACFPACRTGFLCHKGQCISLCNPACEENERCTAKAECVSVCNPPCASNEKCTARAECISSATPAQPGPKK